ncbi:hypothetical protein AJ87_37350 [Rhizobium yanglingense]|nr:hypothetical protein AJ87_37350 [Rhizobium yanglingense]
MDLADHGRCRRATEEPLKLRGNLRAGKAGKLQHFSTLVKGEVRDGRPQCVDAARLLGSIGEISMSRIFFSRVVRKRSKSQVAWSAQ